MRTPVAIVGGEIKFRQAFMCDRCRRHEMGDVVTCHASVDPETVRLSPNNMPVGWSSNGRTVLGVGDRKVMETYYLCAPCTLNGC